MQGTSEGVNAVLGPAFTQVRPSDQYLLAQPDFGGWSQLPWICGGHSPLASSQCPNKSILSSAGSSQDQHSSRTAAPAACRPAIAGQTNSQASRAGLRLCGAPDSRSCMCLRLTACQHANAAGHLCTCSSAFAGERGIFGTKQLKGHASHLEVLFKPIATFPVAGEGPAGRRR